ncbi:MAG: serine/threonine protein kinase [Oligoflexia bacterium]|nr:serine/threonine protein kinase [Oligoflexia bacterium]
MQGDNQNTGIIARPATLLAGRYELLGVIGKGAAGLVYHARDHGAGGREVALKILTNSNAFDENTMARFVSEIETSQLISHPNIVQAYEWVRTDQGMAFSMEYVCGTDLAKHLAAHLLGWEEIDSIMMQLLSAVDELHSHDIVHRDIKLENVLIDANGTIKLTDLGLLKRINEDRVLTRTGVLLGTAQYMPPEYVQAGVYDKRSDIYACGLLLYELITGKRRLSDKKGTEALDYLVETGFRVPPITEGRAGPLPERYKRILDRALDARPRKRFQSADEMRSAFLNVNQLAGEDLGSPEPSITRPLLEGEFGAVAPYVGFWAGIWKNIKAVLGIAVLVFVGGVPSLVSKVSPIPDGRYLGVLVGSDGEVGGPIEIRTDDSVSTVKIDLPGCSGGILDNHSGYISCARKSVRAEAYISSPQQLSVKLFDEQSQRSYRGTLQGADLE